MEMEGYRVTRPLRAIVDLLQNQEVHAEVLRPGLREGLRSGLITVGEARGARDSGLLGDLWDEVR
jgi:hypothetical protein